MTDDLSKNEKRLAMFEQMIAKGSDDPFVWYGRAMELRALGRLDESLAAFGELADRHPDYVPTYLMAGQVAEQLARADEAARWYERGIEQATGRDPHAASELQMARDALEI